MSEPNALVSFCKMRCPKCRQGFVFANKSVFPLGKCIDLAGKCAVCGQEMHLESNKGGGINYALTMSLFFLNVLWYHPLFGLSYKDNSFIYFIFSSIAVVVLAQPWLIRYSRLIYLYFLIKFDKNAQSKAHGIQG